MALLRQEQTTITGGLAVYLVDETNGYSFNTENQILYSQDETNGYSFVAYGVV